MGRISETMEESHQDIKTRYVLNYPIHYSEGSQGDWSVLNFSDPYSSRTLTPDYTASRKNKEGETEKWKISTEENSQEVNVPSNVETRDQLADELKTAYEEVTAQT